MLITGRLGDKYGPKNIYLIGLTVFTLASLWCGFSGDIGMLIVARIAQGLGASMMTPQTMAVITRIFAPDKRGPAMGLWGATAGVAMLVGPILGGVLVDGLGWEWIFFVNVPVGLVAFVMAWGLVPKLKTHLHKFDWLGILLSSIGLFLLVFGIQEGDTYNWGTIKGPLSVWSMIIAGIVFLIAFVWWQAVNKGEPLVPLRLFKVRNFSLANVAISTMGFSVTAMSLPLFFYYQLVRGLTPTQSALMMVPMAVISGVLAPFVGKLVDIVNPRYVAFTGFILMAISLAWTAALMGPDTGIGWFLLPSGLLGVASSGIWAPLSTTATRNLGPSEAGAGAGIYNTTRQIGAVLGSAAIAALIAARLTAEMPAGAGGGVSTGSGQLPEALHAGFSAAMSQSILLPAAAVLLGAAMAILFARPREVSAIYADFEDPAAKPESVDRQH